MKLKVGRTAKPRIVSMRAVNELDMGNSNQEKQDTKHKTQYSQLCILYHIQYRTQANFPKFSKKDSSSLCGQQCTNNEQWLSGGYLDVDILNLALRTNGHKGIEV
jgi:hypothetical protein